MKPNFRLRVRVTKADIQHAKRLEGRCDFVPGWQNPVALATNRSIAEAIKNKEVAIPKTVRTVVLNGTTILRTSAREILATRHRTDVAEYIDRFRYSSVRPKSFRLAFMWY